jgi:hypothetical protein
VLGRRLLLARPERMQLPAGASQREQRLEVESLIAGVNRQGGPSS